MHYRRIRPRNRFRFVCLFLAAVGLANPTTPWVSCLNAEPPGRPEKSEETRPANSDEKLESIEGKVTKVIDGDSIKVKDSDDKEYEVQIEGTDAPEAVQAYGKESTEALRKLVMNRDVRLTWVKKDNFDRLLAQVYVGEEHINARMIQDGHAWHFKRYNKSPELAALEEEARNAKRGLWGTENPQAPWDYRKENRAPDKPDR